MRARCSLVVNGRAVRCSPGDTPLEAALAEGMIAPVPGLHGTHLLGQGAAPAARRSQGRRAREAPAPLSEVPESRSGEAVPAPAPQERARQTLKGTVTQVRRLGPGILEVVATLTRRPLHEPGQHYAVSLPGLPTQTLCPTLRVDGAAECREHAGVTSAIRLELVDEAAERPDVLLQLPHDLIEQAQLEPSQPVDRLVAGGGAIAEGGCGEGEGSGDAGVAGRLDPQVDHVAVDRHGGVAGFDGLDDRPVGAENESLGLEAGTGRVEPEVDDDLGTRSRSVAPGCRHAAGDVKPDRAPRAPPRGAHRDGGVGLRDRLGERDGLTRNLPRRDVQRSRVSVERGDQSVAGEPVDPLQCESVVAMHGERLSGEVRREKGCAGQPLTAPESAKEPPRPRVTMR